VIPLSEEKARMAKALGLDLLDRDQAAVIAARATLRSPLYQSDLDLRKACGVLLRHGDAQDGEIARQMVIMLDRANLKEPEAPPSDFRATFLFVVICASSMVIVLRAVEWWLP
jgi:hypothetical protein